MKIDPVYMKVLAVLFMVWGITCSLYGLFWFDATPSAIPDPDSYFFMPTNEGDVFVPGRYIPNPVYAWGWLYLIGGVVCIGLAVGFHRLGKRESLELRFPEDDRFR